MAPFLENTRGVVLDAVGTLIEPNPGVGEVYRAAAERQSVTLAESLIQERFRHVFRMEFGPDSGGYETSEREERSRWLRIIAATLPELPDQPRAFAELWEHFSRASSWRLYPDVEPAWRSIKARGWRLGVGSNFDSRLRAILGSFSVTKELDALLISSEVGWRKPHPEFYRSVSRALELEPREIVWIGDSPAHDLIGPREAGFQAILLDRTVRYPSFSPRIGTLGEVGSPG